MTESAARRCARRLDAATESVFAALEELSDAFLAEWSDRLDDRGRFSTSDLAPLQTTVFDVLDRHQAFDSAGFVVAEGTLSDRTRHLDWWHRTAAGSYEFLLLNLDPDAADCYDYYAMDWFAVAAADHRRSVSGPLIDLPCADVYILTFAQPMVADGRFLGIAGADVAVSRFESALVPPLRELRTPAVLCNAERRVIASNGATLTTGEKLPSQPGSGDAWATVLPVTTDLGWLLATRD